MHRDLLKLLNATGDLRFAEEPTDESGASAPAEESTPSEDPEPTNPPEDKGFTPITSQEEFDRALGKRLDRERAKFSDYDDLQTKVSELSARNQELEKDLAAAKTTSLKTTIAAESGVPESLLQGETEEALRASATALQQFIDDKISGSTGRTPRPTPYTGTGSEEPPAPSISTGRERARASREH